MPWGFSNKAVGKSASILRYVGFCKSPFFGYDAKFGAKNLKTLVFVFFFASEEILLCLYKARTVNQTQEPSYETKM